MSGIHKRSLAVALGVLALGVAALTPQTGHAAVTSTFAANVLTVTVTATTGQQNVTVAASGTGVIQVNGANVTGDPQASVCTKIAVIGNGQANTIDLSAVTSATFAISSEGTTVSAGAGADTLTGSEFKDVMYGDDGADDFRMSGGNDTLNGLAAADTYYMTPPAAGVTVTLDGGAGTDLIRYDTYPLFNPTRNGFVLDTVAKTITGPGVGTVSYNSCENRYLRPTYTAAGGVVDVGLYLGDAFFSVDGSGNVKVNGNDPDIGGAITPLLASNVTSITVLAQDHLILPNRADLSAVTPANGFTNPALLVATPVSIALNTGPNVTTGSAFRDSIVTTGGNDTVSAGDGDDYVNSGDGADVIECGGGNDSVDAGSGSDTVYGGLGDDTINGNTQQDLVYGDEGDDVIQGGNENDTLYGGDGNDIVLGNANNDLIYGGPGNDQLDGVGNNDTVYGEDGDDVTTYTAGQGTDVLYGDNGNDTFNIQPPAATASVTIDGGEPTVFPGDVLNYDAMLKVVVDDGAVITGPLVGPTAYTSIESAPNITNNTDAPYLTVAPSTLNVYAEPATTASGALTLRNAGNLDLHVGFATIGDQSVPGAFSIQGGDIATTLTIAPLATTSVVVLYEDSLALPGDPPATAILYIYSDSLNVSNVTTVPLIGARNDFFTWNGAIGDWTTAGEWNPTGVPAGEDTATIGAGVTTRSTPLVIDRLYVNRDGAVTSLTLTGGELRMTTGSSSLTIGSIGKAEFAQTGGILNAEGAMYIGNGIGADGSYALSGGKANVTGAMEIGWNGGRGAITVDNDAILTATNSIRVGYTANSTGTVVMNGGTVVNNPAATNTHVSCGRTGNGTWTQNNGTLTIKNSLFVGRDGAAARGLLNLNGGAVSVGLDCVVSGHDANAVVGLGVFNANGGSLTVGDQIFIGRQNHGVMNINGATVNANAAGASVRSVLIGGYDDSNYNAEGRVTVSSGSLNIAATLSLGDESASTGTFVINGGSVSVGDNLAIGRMGYGSLEMSGGSLVANSITTGALGTVAGWSWTGGSIAASTFTLPLTVTNGGGTLLVGGTGVGTTAFTAGTNYTQTGGAIDVGITSGAADQLLLDGSAGAFDGGALNVSLIGDPPLMGASWDVVVATGAGSVAVSSVTVNLPNPTNWSVTSDSTKITVHFKAPARLSAPDLVVVPDITLSLGETTKTKTFEIGNIGDFALQVTSMSLSEPTSFTLLEPTAFPVTLAPRLEDGATTTVTVEFAETTTGTYTATLDIFNDGVTTDVAVQLRAKVAETIISASGVETWRRY